MNTVERINYREELSVDDFEIYVERSQDKPDTAQYRVWNKKFQVFEHDTGRYSEACMYIFSQPLTMNSMVEAERAVSEADNIAQLDLASFLGAADDSAH